MLAWAADEGRILLTQDVRTLIRYARRRVAAGLAMPGVVEVSRRVPVATAIEEILLIVECGTASDFDKQVIFLPL